MKPNKEAYIDFILNELNKGNVQYNSISSLFCSNFQVTTRSFNKYWKIANERYKQARQAINEAKADAIATEEVNAAKTAVLNRLEAIAILTKIAKGTAKRVDGNVLIPSYNDQRMAIETIIKMEGWSAPSKIAQTDSKGNDVTYTEEDIEMMRIFNEHHSNIQKSE